MKIKLDKVSKLIYFISSTSATGTEFNLQLTYYLSDQGGQQPVPLYRIKDVECFLSKYFGYPHGLSLESLLFEKFAFATNTDLHIFLP